MSLHDKGITVATTGSGRQRQKPHAPVKQRENAEEAARGYEGGAPIAHTHVRNPLTKSAQRDVELYSQEVLEQATQLGILPFFFE